MHYLISRKSYVTGVEVEGCIYPTHLKISFYFLKCMSICGHKGKEMTLREIKKKNIYTRKFILISDCSLLLYTHAYSSDSVCPPIFPASVSAINFCRRTLGEHRGILIAQVETLNAILPCAITGTRVIKLAARIELLNIVSTSK